VLIDNVQAARAWFKERGPERGVPLALVGRHEFQLLERTAQPALPGPLPDDYARWGAALAPPSPGLLGIDGPAGTVVDRQRQPIEFRSRRLPVV
jgi:hypothetical protein